MYLDIYEIWSIVGLVFTVWIGSWLVCVLKRLFQTLGTANRLMKESTEVVRDIKNMEQSAVSYGKTLGQQVVEMLAAKLNGRHKE